MKDFLKHILAVGLCFILFTACKQQNAIMGDWIVADSTPCQGFNLGYNGIAASIGHPEKQYLKWSLQNQNLFLSGKEYIDGTAIEFTDTLVITTFAPENELEVWYHENKIRYIRL